MSHFTTLTHVNENVVIYTFNEHCITFGSSKEGKQIRKPLAVRKVN